MNMELKYIRALGNLEPRAEMAVFNLKKIEPQTPEIIEVIDILERGLTEVAKICNLARRKFDSTTVIGSTTTSEDNHETESNNNQRYDTGSVSAQKKD